MEPIRLNELTYQSVPLIQNLLESFKVIDSDQKSKNFEDTIRRYIDNSISFKENYTDSNNQNLHMVKFYWGHDHDFGNFKVSGMMGTRHIWMLSRFFDYFGLKPAHLDGKRILDIGCWTGGVSLVLSRLGANVTSIDEINKYVHALSFQADFFNLKNFECQNLSLYDLEKVGWNEKFDLVFCLGVIYHLSDPIVGLRRIYNSMKPGGILCLESMSIDSEESICEYEGPSKRRGDFGWNWFVPSPRALYQLLEDTGFEDIKVGNGLKEFSVTKKDDPMGENRCFAMAKKKESHVICQAGLSVNIQ
jgi:2-polyprenyl-3-methyl-5-hydroxy-6-metoxy-1,4-benzoquinol methylase